MASSATLAFSSALCRFRCIFLESPLLSLLDTAILSYSLVQFLGDIIYLTAPIALYPLRSRAGDGSFGQPRHEKLQHLAGESVQ